MTHFDTIPCIEACIYFILDYIQTSSSRYFFIDDKNLNKLWIASVKLK